MRYLLDTSAIIQQPEILARASTHKLVIPKAVLEELIARGREHLRSLVGSLIAQALDAGAEVIGSPAQLKNELLASDRNAHRLDGADIEIVRTAIGIAEQSGPETICVITLDRDLIYTLASRGIASLTPTQFLTQAASSKPDPKTLSSAESVSRSQRRYMSYSGAVGAAASFLANVVYSHALFLINTISIWGTVLALPLLGIGLFWYRQRFRLSYGVFEFLVGVMMSSYAFFPDFNYTSLGVVQSIQVLGGLYVMVRGLDNVGKGLENTRFESLWKRLFS